MGISLFSGKPGTTENLFFQAIFQFRIYLCLLSMITVNISFFPDSLSAMGSNSISLIQLSKSLIDQSRRAFAPHQSEQCRNVKGKTDKQPNHDQKQNSLHLSHIPLASF